MKTNEGESKCATCHYKWKTGQDGTHSCIEHLKKHVEKIEKVALALQSRVVWALKFMKCPGSGMMVERTEDGGFSGGIHWTQWFADGVEMMGHYKVDRELLGLSQKEQDKIIKARKATQASAEKEKATP